MLRSSTRGKGETTGAEKQVGKQEGGRMTRDDQDDGDDEKILHPPPPSSASSSWDIFFFGPASNVPKLTHYGVV